MHISYAACVLHRGVHAYFPSLINVVSVHTSPLPRAYGKQSELRSVRTKRGPPLVWHKYAVMTSDMSKTYDAQWLYTSVAMVPLIEFVQNNGV